MTPFLAVLSWNFTGHLQLFCPPFQAETTWSDQDSPVVQCKMQRMDFCWKIHGGFPSLGALIHWGYRWFFRVCAPTPGSWIQISRSFTTTSSRVASSSQRRKGQSPNPPHSRWSSTTPCWISGSTSWGNTCGLMDKSDLPMVQLWVTPKYRPDYSYYSLQKFTVPLKSWVCNSDIEQTHTIQVWDWE